MAAVLLLVASSARSETPATGRSVVLIAASGAATVANRLRAEAAEAGVALVDDGSAGLNEQPAAVCARNRAVGVIRVWSEVRVALYLQATGDAPALSETIEVSPGDRDSLPLRIVEEVRSRFVPAPERERERQPTRKEQLQATSPEPRPTPAIAAAESPAPAPYRPSGPSVGVEEGARPLFGAPTLGLAGGLAAGASAGGLGPSLDATVAVAARVGSGLGVSIRGAFPLFTRDLTAREGSVRWRPWRLTIEAIAEPWRRPRLALTLGAEAGAAFIDLAPTAAEDHVANPDLITVAVFLVGAGVRAQVFEGLALRAGVSLGISAPHPVVRVDGREVASWGRPLVIASLATELRLLDFNRRPLP